MTLEEKELLIKDLCARLPYHPNIKVYNDGWDGMKMGEFDTSLQSHHIDAFWYSRIEIIPYLRPLYSMTEEEKKEWYNNIQKSQECSIENSETSITYINDWLLEHHFDVHGLIKRGLALEANKEIYKDQ